VIDGEKVELMRAYLEVALTGFEEHFGVQVEIGRMSYSASNVNITLQASEIGTDGTALTREAEAFKHSAHLYDMSPEWLGAHFTAMGKRFKITGLNTRAKKYKVQAIADDGTRYKFSHKSIREYME